MKTIDKAVEKALELFNSEILTEMQIDNETPCDWFVGGFKAGVEFAQRWIFVENKLPENDDFVLVKDNTGLYEVGYYDLSDKLWVTPSSSLMSFLDITHWRPINLE